MRSSIRKIGVGVLCLYLSAAFASAADDLAANLAALKSKDTRARMAAATAIGELGAAAGKYVPDLVACIRTDEVDAVRGKAAFALGNIGDAAVPSLVEFLKNDDAREVVAKKAHELRLARYGLIGLRTLRRDVAEKTAIPALADLMSRSTFADFVWRNAADALLSMGPGSKATLNAAFEREFGTAGRHVLVIAGTDLKNRAAAVAALSQDPAHAAKAAPYLMRCLADRRDEAIQNAVADVVTRIGADAVPALVKMLEEGDVDVLSTNGGIDRAFVAIAALEKMDEQVKLKTVIPALAAMAAQRKGVDAAWNNAVEALGRMGPQAIPVLVAELNRGRGLSDVPQKIGAAARPYVGKVLESYATVPPWNTGARWRICDALGAIPPEADSIAALLNLMRADDLGMVQDLGMVLDRIGPPSVLALVELLSDKDWYARWAATAALELMGPKAKEALPALEETLKNESEDIDVRIGAARAIAAIRGIDPAGLYSQVPDLSSRIVKTTRDKSAARRKEFMREEIASVSSLTDSADPVESTHNRWRRTAGCVYCLATNQNVEASNASLRQMAESGDVGNFMDVNLIRAFMLFHSKSEFFPGRLSPDTEAALKKYYFDKCDDCRGHSKKGQSAWNVTTRDLVPGEAGSHREPTSKRELIPGKTFVLHGNGPLNYSTRDYMGLSVLKDDPQYKDRKLKAGDTVTERYNAWNEHFKRFLKDWSLHGLWIELGSSYEYHTYSSLFNLADLAPDPVVRQRARMYLDLCMVEAQQISIAGLRGGTKCRAKQGGLGSPFNPYLHMLFGERGRLLSHAQIAVSPYHPPEPAVLLHKLGPCGACYEIANRQAGEQENEDERSLRMDSHMLNYAWCTPEYVMGCSVYDPNRPYAHACQGRWSGVIFRNRAMIALPGYSGEKWNVQSKDVMITQRCAGSYYGGLTRVDLTSGFDKAERDGWVFLSTGDAYAAINIVTGGYLWADPVKGSLVPKDQYSPMIIQTGRAADHGSFEKFQDAVLKAPLKLESAANHGKRLTKVEYTGPNSKKVEFFAQSEPFILPRLDGKPIDLELQYNYRSPYLENRQGSDVVTVRYGNRRWDYDFAANTVTTAQQ